MGRRHLTSSSLSIGFTSNMIVLSSCLHHFVTGSLQLFRRPSYFASGQPLFLPLRLLPRLFFLLRPPGSPCATCSLYSVSSHLFSFFCLLVTFTKPSERHSAFSATCLAASSRSLFCKSRPCCLHSTVLCASPFPATSLEPDSGIPRSLELKTWIANVELLYDVLNCLNPCVVKRATSTMSSSNCGFWTSLSTTPT